MRKFIGPVNKKWFLAGVVFMVASNVVPNNIIAWGLFFAAVGVFVLGAFPSEPTEPTDTESSEK